MTLLMLSSRRILFGLSLCMLLHLSPAWSETPNGDGPEQRQIDFAHGLFHRGFFEEAMAEYKVYVDTFPSGPHLSEAWLRLGECATSTGDFETAAAAFASVLERFEAGTDNHAAAAVGRGEALYFQQAYEASKEAFNQAAGEGIASRYRARALYYLGRIAQSANDPGAALSYFELLIGTAPEHPLATFGRFQLAGLLGGRGELERAAVEYAQVASGEGDTELRAESRYRAAEVYDKLGWHGSAVGEYRLLREAFPESSFAGRATYGYAWALYRDGQFEAAAAEAQQFLDAAGDSEDAAGMTFLRASCLQQMEAYPEALAAFESVIERFPDTPYRVRAAYRRAWVKYLTGDLSAAKTDATAFVQENPGATELPQAAFLLGSIHLTEGSYDAAYGQFRLIAETYPESEFAPEALFKAAECQSELGVPAQAAASFQDFATRYPEHGLAVQAQLRAGDAYFAAREFAGAVEAFRGALDRELEAAQAADTRFRLASALLRAGDMESSVAEFSRYLETNPEGPARIEAHYRLGALYLRHLQDPVQAIAHLEAALSAGPEGEWAGVIRRDLALARFEHKDFEQAAKLFLQTMEEHPDIALNEETYAWTGQYYFEHDDWAKTVQVLESLLRVAPEYPNPERVLFTIAEAVEHSGELEGALARYQAVIDRSNSSAAAVEAAYRSAGLHERLGNGEKALALYEEAANANSGDLSARARFRIGEIHFDAQEFDKAARSFMRVAILFLHPELSPQALLRAGQAYEAANNQAQALRAYEELLNDFPESAPAEAARAARDALAMRD